MDQDVADLWTIAVGDYDFIFIGEAGDDFANFASDLFLIFSGDFAIFL